MNGAEHARNRAPDTAEQSGAHIHIDGIVQGVGFRPFVYGLATELSLRGWVKNTSAGVDIELDGAAAVIDRFLEALQSQAPPLAQIHAVHVERQASHGFDGFRIVASQAVPSAFQPISPDVSICPDCLHELFNPADRRYRYPFINCTNCGPRFTIIQDIPYDRPNTTMRKFEMCSDCREEYEDPLDRRFHAQPVACPVCGPQVWLELDGTTVATQDNAIGFARDILQSGGIVAIKGLGGFHLACDATNASAVDELRRRKGRVDKPFALMMADLEVVGRHCQLEDAERALLESRERPIVILDRLTESNLALAVAPGQHTVATMLPYTPLHALLLELRPGYPDALVMTSGNYSEEPIATDNDEARRRLYQLADAFLMHDRDIQTRCDDSVVRVRKSMRYPIRRSRGYAPTPLRLPFELPSVLACGAELKNTFCLTRECYGFMSHHIGDLENYETLAAFEQGIEHFERLFRIQPELIAYDLHPDYLATHYALERAERQRLPVMGVQHHHAHIAAVMADAGLSGDQPVIGVAFDGTGYGEDGAIWGGEFLLADYHGYQRLAHGRYFPMPGGDTAIRHPWRLALGLLRELGIDPLGVPTAAGWADPEQQRIVEQQLERKLNAPATSSVGRLFDAVAALTGIRAAVNYEAQAAIELEAVADRSEPGLYSFDLRAAAASSSAREPDCSILDPAPMIEELLTDLRSGVPVSRISTRFHRGLARAVVGTCQAIRAQTAVRQVALSGGVWQNRLLLDLTTAGLSEAGFETIVHRQIPANDGGLALGQALIGGVRAREGSTALATS